MPELPEVETVRRVLKSNLVHQTIESIDVFYQGILEDPIDEFLKNTLNKTIIDIKRYGKYLIFELNKGFILSHLRMEGKYYYLENSFMEDKHIHVVFHFKDNSTLYYKDVRKFGRMKYIDKNIYNELPLSKLGPDLILNENIDLDDIYHKIHTSKKAIKPLLLDQEIVAGLGNIYVDEVLFSARINPLKKGYRITKSNLKDILKESKRILTLAIEHKGTTIKSYTSSLGVEGEYQAFLQVHTKNICPNCKIALNRVKIDKRMTYYCKNCQR